MEMKKVLRCRVRKWPRHCFRRRTEASLASYNAKTALKIAIGSKRTKDNLGPVFGQDVVYDILVLGSKNWSNILFPSEVIWRHGVLNPRPP